MSTYYVAHCGGVMSENGYVPSASGNVANIVDGDGNFYPDAKNETDADAFIFEKDEDTNSVTLHVFKCNTSPKMICTYDDCTTDNTKLLEHSSDIWKKHIIGVYGDDNIDYEVLADYNDFIGEDGIKTRGYANPKKVEFSFINLENGNDMKTTTTSGMFSGCTDLTSCEIPFQMRNIANRTFDGCTSLSSYTKNPDFIDTIGIGAFLNCESLPTIKIGKYTNLSGSSAFTNCTSASAISWNNLASDERKTRMSSIPNSAFANCNMLTSTIFSDGVQSKIVIPSGITSIGNEAFYGCERASAITLNSVDEIGVSAFENCYGLREVNEFNNVTSVGASAFANAGGGDEIYFDSDFNSLDTIGDSAFTNVHISCDGMNLTLEEISVGAFQNAVITVPTSSTVSINGFPSALTRSTTIYSNAFKGATINGDFEIKGGFDTQIDDYAIDDLNINGNLIISGCEIRKVSGITSNDMTFKNVVDIERESLKYCRCNDFKISGTTISYENFKYLECGHLYINNCQIGAGAFLYANVSDSIVISSETATTVIDEGGFYGMFGVTSIEFYGPVVIRLDAFDGDGEIETVTFHDNDPMINYAFTGRTIENLIFEGSIDVSNMQGAFHYATFSGGGVYLYGNTQVITHLNYAFDTQQNITFYVPENLVSAYVDMYGQGWTFNAIRN